MPIFPEAGSERTRGTHLLPVSTCPLKTSGFLPAWDSLSACTEAPAWVRPDGARPLGATACPGPEAGGQEGDIGQGQELCGCLWASSPGFVLVFPSHLAL